MKKLLKNKKALSPVVAAIILIAVTVAVSIAVAAWMGSMTFTFMETEELRITSVTFSTTSVTVNVRNTGTTDIVVISGTINSADGSLAANVPVSAGGTAQISLSADADGYTEGSSTIIELLTSKGNQFAYTTTATATAA